MTSLLSLRGSPHTSPHLTSPHPFPSRLQPPPPLLLPPFYCYIFLALFTLLGEFVAILTASASKCVLHEFSSSYYSSPYPSYSSAALYPRRCDPPTPITPLVDSRPRPRQPNRPNPTMRRQRRQSRSGAPCITTRPFRCFLQTPPSA